MPVSAPALLSGSRTPVNRGRRPLEAPPRAALPTPLPLIVEYQTELRFHKRSNRPPAEGGW